MATDATNATRTPASNRDSTGMGFTRESNAGPRTIGLPARQLHGARLFNYDLDAGRAGLPDIVFFIDQSDRMPVDKAAAMLTSLEEAVGVHREPEAVRMAFASSLFVTQALNGSSQLLPSERVAFSVRMRDGATLTVQYSDIMTRLGVDARRFFRAYASFINAAVKRVYEYLGSDPQMLDLRDAIVALADKRGLSRCPWIISDAADADNSLSPALRTMVIASKSMVIGASSNSVDRRPVHMVPQIRSADGYESSLPAVMASTEYRD